MYGSTTWWSIPSQSSALLLERLAPDAKRGLYASMVDFSFVVPSSRAFFPAIATQKKRFVLVPLVDRVDDAVALAAAGVTAFAVASPGSLMRAVSDATGSAP